MKGVIRGFVTGSHEVKGSNPFSSTTGPQVSPRTSPCRRVPLPPWRAPFTVESFLAVEGVRYAPEVYINVPRPRHVLWP